MDRPTTTAPMALAAQAAIVATARPSPGRSGSPASSARSSLVDMGPPDYTACCTTRQSRAAQVSEHSTECRVAIEDGDVAALESARAPEAQVGGKDVPEHHLRPQLCAGAGV